MRLFLLLILSTLCFAAEVFPPEVLAAEEKNEKAAKDIKAEADAKLAKANADLVKVYTKAQEAATKKGDLKLALAINAKAEKLQDATDLLAPPKAKPMITIEALIDGGSELHIVFGKGVYWAQVGTESKPGMHQGRNEPTLVNGTKWMPKWNGNGSTGPDTCSLLPVDAPEGDWEIKSGTPGGTSLRSAHGEMVLSIPDPEAGSHAYKITLGLK